MFTNPFKASGLSAGSYGTHSLRIGWANAAIAAQRRTGAVDLLALMSHGRWQRVETMRGYERRFSLWDKHPGRGILAEEG